MKKIITMLLAILTISVYAQHDTNAKDILEKVSAKTKTYNTIKAEFTYTLINEVEDFSETFEGIIYIKNNMFKLDFMDTETYCDGKIKWVYLKESEEVNIVDVVNENDEESENDFLNNPAKLLSIYESGFKYLYVEDKTLNGIEVSVVDLVPENLDQNYSRVRLFINKAKSQIYSLKYFSKDGNNYEFTINKFETNLNLDDSYFIYDKKQHPNVEIIDLRE